GPASKAACPTKLTTRACGKKGSDPLNLGGQTPFLPQAPVVLQYSTVFRLSAAIGKRAKMVGRSTPGATLPVVAPRPWVGHRAGAGFAFAAGAGFAVAVVVAAVAAAGRR